MCAVSTKDAWHAGILHVLRYCTYNQAGIQLIYCRKFSFVVLEPHCSDGCPGEL
jgi:hypothetical protein